MLGTIAKLFSKRPLADAYRYVVIHGQRVHGFFRSASVEGAFVGSLI